MTHDGHGYRITTSWRASKERTSHRETDRTPIGLIWEHAPRRNALSKSARQDEKDEWKRNEASKQDAPGKMI